MAEETDAPQGEQEVALQGLRDELTSKHASEESHPRRRYASACFPPALSHACSAPLFQVKDVTEKHNTELTNIMTAQQEELLEMRQTAAAARQVELTELKAAHATELEGARGEARAQALTEAASTEALAAAEAAAAEARESYQAELEGLERTAAQLGESEAALNAKAAAANAELRAGREVQP